MTVDSNTQPIALHPPNISHHIRPVHPTDIQALRQDCWAHRSITRSRENIQKIINAHKNKRGLGIIVQDQQSSTIIGYGQTLRLSNCHEISDLIVSENFRNQGIGTALIQYLIQAIRPIAIPIEIGVAESNPRALALYQRLGFTHAYDLSLNLGNGREIIHYLQLTTH